MKPSASVPYASGYIIKAAAELKIKQQSFYISDEQPHQMVMADNVFMVYTQNTVCACLTRIKPRSAADW